MHTNVYQCISEKRFCFVFRVFLLLDNGVLTVFFLPKRGWNVRRIFVHELFQGQHCWSLHFTIVTKKQRNTWPAVEAGWSRVSASHPGLSGSHTPLDTALELLGSGRWTLIAFLLSQHLRGKKKHVCCSLYSFQF